MGTITIIDGIPHVADSMVLSSEPTIVTRYWPLPSASGQVDEGDEATYRHDGIYSVRSSRWGFRNFRLPDGVATKSVKTEETPVPKPRTRLPLRWYLGRWEKLSKSRGWIPA
jgi:hypothetical protein